MSNHTEKILIGEDSSVIQTLTKQVLTQQQFIVHTVKNGEQALEKLKTELYSLILLDIFMPVMDGFACINAIRSMEEPYCNIPAFAITGNAHNLTEEEFFRAGFNEVLVKPLDYDLLVELANAYIRSKS